MTTTKVCSVSIKNTFDTGKKLEFPVVKYLGHFHTFTIFIIQDRAKCDCTIGHLGLFSTRKVKNHEIS